MIDPLKLKLLFEIKPSVNADGESASERKCCIKRHGHNAIGGVRRIDARARRGSASDDNRSLKNCNCMSSSTLAFRYFIVLPEKSILFC